MTPAKTVYDALVTADADAKQAVIDATAKMNAAKEACKVAAFGMAQQAYEEAEEIKAAKTALAAEVKRVYDAKSVFPTDGTAGTLCNYPAGGADGADAERL